MEFAKLVDTETWIANAEKDRLVSNLNQAHFWSGVPEGDAARMGTQRGGVTLENLMREQVVHFPSLAEDEPWDILAREYALKASGEVTVFYNPARANPNGCWIRIELPALQINPNVTKITQIEVATDGTIVGDPKVIFER